MKKSTTDRPEKFEASAIAPFPKFLKRSAPSKYTHFKFTRNYSLITG